MSNVGITRRNVLTLGGLAALAAWPVHSQPLAQPGASSVEARQSTFDEVWETVRDRFYDRDLHGLDWPAVRRRYQPLAASADSGHFEYFRNTRVIDASTTFEVALARSCITLTVPSGKSILEMMRENGIEIASSCEQGACGTCAATVLEGEPIHQDVYLNDAEKLSGTKIMTCVSRAKSARLVLDL